MANGLELHGSRINCIELIQGIVTIHFSHAYIYKSKGRPGRDPGTGWSQEAILFMNDATISTPFPELPSTISEAYLEVGGIKHELIPLPFKRKVNATFWVRFENNTEIEIEGKRPYIELSGKSFFIEEF